MSTPKRVSISLACVECGSRNYRTTRQVKQGAKAIELSKFCAICKKHTKHRETK